MTDLVDVVRAEAGTFLSRLVRLDPVALVRLRPADPPVWPGGAGRALALWARLPWDVLAARRVSGETTGDVTLAAADLLTVLRSGGADLPPRRDAQWRWPLPAGTAEVVETLPEAEIRRLGAAAAETLRDAIAHGVAGRPVGERLLRDTLLDHVAVTVTTGTRRIEIRQRLVQGLLRTGLLGAPPAAGDVSVLVTGGWLGLGTRYGMVWRHQQSGLALRPRRADQVDRT